MINISSRYTTSSAVDGTVIATRKPTTERPYTVYTVKDGDTLDLLAAAVYGDPKLWWQIADMNPHISFPDLIRAGDVIRIPA